MFLQNLASMLLLDCAHTLHSPLFYVWKNYPEFVNIQTCSAGLGSSVFSQCAGNRSLYCSCRITLHNILGILTLLLCTASLVGSTFWNQEELYTLWKSATLQHIRWSLVRSKGAQWLSGRVLDSRPKGRGFEPHRCHCVVSFSKNNNPSLVLV